MSDRSYGHEHGRWRALYRFGKASDYLCWMCGGSAEVWAYLWQTYSDPIDPESYSPMCHECRSDYDIWQNGLKWDDLRLIDLIGTEPGGNNGLRKYAAERGR